MSNLVKKECKDCIHDVVCPTWNYHTDNFAERDPNTCGKFKPKSLELIVDDILSIIDNRIERNKYHQRGQSNPITVTMYSGKALAYLDIKEIIEQKYKKDTNPIDNIQIIMSLGYRKPSEVAREIYIEAKNRATYPSGRNELAFITMKDLDAILKKYKEPKK